MPAMDLFKNAQVQKYVSSLKEINPSQYKLSVCQCLQKNLPDNAHAEVATSFVSNCAELAAIGEISKLGSIVLYITMTTYFNGNTMKFFINKMFKCEDITTVSMFSNVLECNFDMHPPCAKYMSVEYEELLLIPYRNYFKKMSLWDYLIDRLKCLVNGSYLYGNNEVYDSTFKWVLKFSINILNVDFEVSKKKSSKALVLKCLKNNSERKTRMYEITTLLDKLINTGYDLETPIIDFALLINNFR